MKTYAIEDYDKKHVDILAAALEKAFKSVDCDLRCFDWLSYRPDYWIKKEEAKWKDNLHV